MKRILILEDEYFLLESMIKFMNGLDQVRAIGCVNLADALATLDEHPPDLVFSDINLPDGSGLELIHALSNRGISVPLIFVSAYISDYRNRIPTNSNIMVLEKPVSMKRLRAIAREKLDQDEREYRFELSDYLQISAMGGHTMRLNCGHIGTIIMVQGELWSAQDGQGEGEPAFKRLVAQAQVHGAGFDLSCKRIDDTHWGERNITGNLNNLLLNAVFEEEEHLRYGGQAANRVAPPPQPNDMATFNELIDQGIAKLLSKDYRQALDLFTRAGNLKPEDSLVKTNILRLNELGYALQEERS